MKVEIWSDVVCPWCYIGKRRFEKASAAFAHADQLDVTWRSFQLDPSAPRQSSGDLVDRLANKYGIAREEAIKMNARVVEHAAGVGLSYRLDIAKPGNTFDAHRVLHLAAGSGRRNAAKERLLSAYFTEGEPISDPTTLVRLVSEVGVDPNRAGEVLAGDEYSESVRADERAAVSLGIRGVPFFVIDRRFGLSGAQPSEVMLAALDEAWMLAVSQGQGAEARAAGEAAD